MSSGGSRSSIEGRCRNRPWQCLSLLHRYRGGADACGWIRRRGPERGSRRGKSSAGIRPAGRRERERGRKRGPCRYCASHQPARRRHRTEHGSLRGKGTGRLSWTEWHGRKGLADRRECERGRERSPCRYCACQRASSGRHRAERGILRGRDAAACARIETRPLRRSAGRCERERGRQRSPRRHCASHEPARQVGNGRRGIGRHRGRLCCSIGRIDLSEVARPYRAFQSSIWGSARAAPIQRQRLFSREKSIEHSRKLSKQVIRPTIEPGLRCERMRLSLECGIVSNDDLCR